MVQNKYQLGVAYTMTIFQFAEMLSKLKVNGLHCTDEGFATPDAGRDGYLLTDHINAITPMTRIYRRLREIQNSMPGALNFNCRFGETQQWATGIMDFIIDLDYVTFKIEQYGEDYTIEDLAESLYLGKWF